MESDPDPRRLETVEEMAAALELTGVRFLELNARWPEDGEARPSEAAFDMQVQQRLDPTHLEVRFRMDAHHPSAEYVLVVQVSFESPVAYESTVDVTREYIERVAIMVAYPYLREGLSSLAARIEAPVPILGLLRQGEFSLAPMVPADVVWPSHEIELDLDA